MAYTLYEKLNGPNDVLGKMRDFLVNNGWSILNNCTPDLDIFGSGTADGQVLAAKIKEVYVIFRSANGKIIFEDQQNSNNAFGIGVTCATNYTANPPSGKWFDQPNVVRNTAQKVVGAGIPVRAAENYRLYCNHITDPLVMTVFSLELEPGLFQHLAVGEVQKVGTWGGGTVFSGTKSSYNMFPAGWDADQLANGSNHLFGSSNNPSTFCRVDVDAAPLRQNPILWGAAGPVSAVCGTGKILGSTITNIECVGAAWFPKIPHYAYLESQSGSDYGRNVNTLNCISVNMPIALFIQRDPDALMNFSQIGYVTGIYFISMRNVAPASVYEISYPKSGNLHQTFPNVKRAGLFGYDGVSVVQ